MTKAPPILKDRISTTDVQGRRVKVIPMAAPKKGFWHRRRFHFQWAMLTLYVALPWIQIKGHPLLQLDIEHRRFSILGQLFFAHEVPNLVFIVVAFLMGIALVTTLFGRVWCGWACPQTVFIERIFQLIERWIEGDHLKQKRLYHAQWDSHKVLLRVFKWSAFFFVALFLSHSFIAYFVGAQNAFAMMSASPAAHPAAFFWVSLMVAVVLFDFGWFREQFCLIACPYGRFQSVMMDEGSLFLAYQESRGDCIECNKCVAVCPTGIDVRNGLQFECIACTACADACDSVMQKIGKPLHLIGYGSLNSLAGKAVKVIRGRTLVYGSLLVLSLSLLVYRLSSRQTLQSEFVRAVDTPYQVVKLPNANGAEISWVINHFKARFYNLDWHAHQPKLLLPEALRAKGIELIQGGGATPLVQSGESVEQQFFIKVPLSELEKVGMTEIQLQTEWDKDLELESSGVRLVGPNR